MNEHLLKTSDANVLSSREKKKKKTQENLMGGGGIPPCTSEGYFSWRGILLDMDQYFQMCTTLERKKKLRQEIDVSYCTMHRSLKVTAIYHQSHQYKTSTKLLK